MMKSVLNAMRKAATLSTISVQYRNVDGYHVFTSADMRGLYVASKDARQAFDSVGPLLQELFAIKTGQACDVEPARDFNEFMDAVRDHRRRQAPQQILGDRQFVIRCAA